MSAATLGDDASALLVDQLRQAEVEDLHAPVRRDEHVVRLQVAMDDALLVRGGEARARSARRSRAPCAPGCGPLLSRSRSVSPSSSSMTRCRARRRARRRRRPRGCSGDSAPRRRALPARSAASAAGIGRGVRGKNLDRDVAPEPRVAARDRPRPSRPRRAEKRFRRDRDGHRMSAARQDSLNPYAFPWGCSTQVAHRLARRAQARPCRVTMSTRLPIPRLTSMR